MIFNGFQGYFLTATCKPFHMRLFVAQVVTSARPTENLWRQADTLRPPISLNYNQCLKVVSHRMRYVTLRCRASRRSAAKRRMASQHTASVRWMSLHNNTVAASYIYVVGYVYARVEHSCVSMANLPLAFIYAAIFGVPPISPARWPSHIVTAGRWV